MTNWEFLLVVCEDSHCCVEFEDISTEQSVLVGFEDGIRELSVSFYVIQSSANCVCLSVVFSCLVEYFEFVLSKQF